MWPRVTVHGGVQPAASVVPQGGLSYLRRSAVARHTSDVHVERAGRDLKLIQQHRLPALLRRQRDPASSHKQSSESVRASVWLFAIRPSKVLHGCESGRRGRENASDPSKGITCVRPLDPTPVRTSQTSPDRGTPSTDRAQAGRFCAGGSHSKVSEAPAATLMPVRARTALRPVFATTGRRGVCPRAVLSALSCVERDTTAPTLAAAQGATRAVYGEGTPSCQRLHVQLDARLQPRHQGEGEDARRCRDGAHVVVARGAVHVDSMAESTSNQRHTRSDVMQLLARLPSRRHGAPLLSASAPHSQRVLPTRKGSGPCRRTRHSLRTQAAASAVDVSEAKTTLITAARSLATTPDDDGKVALLSLVDELKGLVPPKEAKPAGG